MKPTFDSLLPSQEVYERIVALKHEIAALRKGAGTWEALRQGIAEIAESQEVSRANEFQSLVEKVEKQEDGEDRILGNDEAEEMLLSCDNFRFRMAAVALGLEADTLSGELSSEGAEKSGTTVRAAGGVTYASFSGNIIILLPDIQNKEQNDRVLKDLLEIFDSPNGDRSNWLVDFSAMTHRPPVMLIGVLKGYMDELQRKGASLFFSWLKPSLLSESFLDLTKRTFSLKQIGGYLFYQEYDC